jgi:integrase
VRLIERVAVGVGLDADDRPARDLRQSGLHHLCLGVAREERLVAPLLASIPRKSDYLFPSRNGSPLVSFNIYKRRLDDLSGVTDWTLHDLRRTFSSKCAEWQIASPDIIERLLGHTTALSPVARIYNRWHYLPQMRTALELYEGRLSELIAE